MTKPATFLAHGALTRSFLAIATASMTVLGSMQFSAMAAVDSAPKVVLEVENTSQSTYITDRVRDQTAVGDRMFFFRDHFSEGVGSAELWVSDGSVAGTKLITQIQRNYDEDDTLEAVGELIYFFQAFQDDILSDAIRYELWKSNGSSSGTVKVKDFGANFGALGCASDASYCFEPGVLEGTSNRLFIKFRNQNNDHQVWVSNGASDGTVEVASSTLSLDRTAAVGETLFFRGTDKMLWKTTDGSVESTEQVTTTVPGDGNDGVRDIEVVGDFIYYAFADETSNDLWRSNGTLGAGEQMTTEDRGPDDLTRVSSQLYFLDRNENLRFSNGNPGENELIHDPDDSDEVGNLTAVGDSLFYTVGDGGDSEQLWMSGGPVPTKSLVKDAYAEDSAVYGMTAVEDKLFFMLSGGVNSGTLWSSDGTETSQIVSESGAIGSVSSSSITAAGGILYFTTNVAGELKLWSFNLNSPAASVRAPYSPPVVPVSNLQSKVVRFADFSSNSSALSKKTRAGLSKAIKTFTSVNNVVCTGYTSGVSATASQRKLALDRARQACKVIKKHAPGLTVKLQAKPAQGTGAEFRAVRVKITGK